MITHAPGDCAAGTGIWSKPEEQIMDDQTEDQPVLNYIQRLAAEEHQVFLQEAADKGRSEAVGEDPDRIGSVLGPAAPASSVT